MTESNRRRDHRPSSAGRPPTPRWVRVVGVLLAVVAVLIAVALLSGVEHGPGMHASTPVREPVTVVGAAAAWR